MRRKKLSEIKRKPPKVKVVLPPGAFDLWRVTTYNGKRWESKGVFLDEDKAWETADLLNAKGPAGMTVNVEHKACIALGGKVYMIYINPLNDLTEEDLDAQFAPSSRILASTFGRMPRHDATSDHAEHCRMASEGDSSADADRDVPTHHPEGGGSQVNRIENPSPENNSNCK
jgi:hypothetical protein